MEIKPEFKNKAIRSYVVRAGRITSGQKNAFKELWPSYGLSLHGGRLNGAQVFGNTHPLVLEVGFGMGDSLLQMAQAEPDKNFIGIEVHSPGVGSLMTNAAKAGVRNLKIYMADAIDVLEDCIEPGSVCRFQLYFPDPWHKKKHHKRRIVQPQFVQQVWDKLMVGGIFHMATDWEPYAESMVEVMDGVRGFRNCAPVGTCYSPRPPYRPVTKFERRGERLGHGVWDLLFERT